MSYKATDDLANDALAAIKTAMDAGFLHMFAGTVPATPAVALDMVNTHTLIATVTKDGDGSTGLTFATPASAAMSKTAAEEWKATASFDGADEGEASLTAAFFRFCTPGDNGQGVASAKRLQGTIGVTGSGADMERSSVVISAAQAIEIATFIVRLGSIG